MARLIDADALIRTHKSEVVTIWKDWTVDGLATAIETAPTIDAIPVTWLQKIRDDDRLTIDDVETIDLILVWWHQEQEEENG